MPIKSPTVVKPRRFTDANIEALQDFELRGTFRDTGVVGLRLRVGVRRMSWFFFQEHRKHGTRSTTCKLLGHWPAMNVADARKDALKIAGRIAADRIEPGKRSAAKFADAMDEYLAHLVRQSERRGKPARWAKNVRSLSRLYLTPQWGKWPLAEMSGSPAAVRDWHIQVTKDAGPTTANRCVQTMRACYKHAAKLNRSLPIAFPTSAVVMNAEKPSQKALAFEDFPKWKEAWDKIEAPIRKAYHLFCLLSGCRPGELARLRWIDVHDNEQSFTIPNAKAGRDIVLPCSEEIAAALRMARDAAKEGAELVFPGLSYIDYRDAGLPVKGQALRHTYRTICADLEIDELISHYLMGHAPQGISQKYIATLILQNGPAMRAAQERISKRIVSLLGLKLGGHHDAPLVPDTPTRVEASRKKSKAAAPVRIA
jgi:integrase